MEKGDEIRGKARRLRADRSVHYNCAQTVVMSFADDCGIPEEKGRQLAAHFGMGMKMGATCGAVTGGLMVIGLLGGGDTEAREFMKAMRDGHGGLTDCRDLLQRSAQRGGNRWAFCDRLVDDAIDNVLKVMKMEGGTSA